jgi:NADPH:quinone reductase-like Zn-dependent oxidoreductase
MGSEKDKTDALDIGKSLPNNGRWHMKAVVVDDGALHCLRFADVPEPAPLPGQVVIEVHSFSLNPGELKWADRSGARHEEFGFSNGTVVGHDSAGVVVVASRDGRGPAVGTRVASVGFCGSWAERYVSNVDMLAVIPNSVEFGEAAALPMAGGTALGSLQLAGTTIGRRLMVTAAGGGVGRVAVQLAAISGSYVVASVGTPEKGEGLKELGANEVVVGVEGIQRINGPIDIVLDAAGGEYMVAAWDKLARDGTMVTCGWATLAPAIFAPFSMVGQHGKKIVSFSSETSNGETIAALLDLVARGRLKVTIGRRGSWSALHDSIDALWSRQIKGKVVLDVD